MLRKLKEMTFIDAQGLLVSLSRQFILMSVLAPTGELLSFASPRQLLPALPYLLHPCSRKESIQRKGDPDSAYILRFSLLARVFEGPSLALRKRAASMPLPLRAYFTKSCDARGGITGDKPLCVTSVN
jgi:hypothetical protein